MQHLSVGCALFFCVWHRVAFLFWVAFGSVCSLRFIVARCVCFLRPCRIVAGWWLQAASVIRSLPTLLNIPPDTLKRRLRMLSYGLLPWNITPDSLTPSILGRLLTTPDARLMRLGYLAFLHGFASPLPQSTTSEADDGEDLESAEEIPAEALGAATATDTTGEIDAAVASVLGLEELAASRKRSALQESTADLATGALSEEPEQVNAVELTPAQIEGRMKKIRRKVSTGDQHTNPLYTEKLKAPLSYVIMSEDEFLQRYPRFSRWLRRKNRSLNVLSVWRM
jgi:hypothetical protein